jgi:Fe-S-cluster containining protein
MLTDLVQIRRLGSRKEKENKRFTTYIERHKYPGRRLRRLAQEIHEEIDCTKCANCCREGEAGVSKRDVERLANFLGLSPDEFRQRYTMRAKDNDLILKRSDKDGCVFLKDNQCSVYDARPKACADYPHLVHVDGSVAARMWIMPERATYCPIVYNWMEAAKKEVNFR